jgi:uncharacterized protein (TIGR02145 family)
LNSLTRAGRFALTYALALLSASCSGDSPSAPPAANLTVTASATTITASDPVALRLGGSPVDSLGAVTIGGAAISAGFEGDSIVRLLMPLGPSGPVTITVNAWSGRTAVSASATIQRVAAISVGDETAYLATVLANLDAALDGAAALPAPDGIVAADLAADIATLRQWRDSLAARIAALDPASRTLALTMIAESEARATGAADAAILALAADCSSWRLSLSCLARARDRLTRANASTQSRLAYTLGITGVAVAAATAAPAVAAIAGTVALYNYIKSGSEFADYVTSSFDEATAPAVRMLGELSESSDLRVGSSLRDASVVTLPTFRPDVAVTVPVVRQSRNALPTDSGLAVVGALPSLIAGVRDYWDQLMDLLPEALRVRPPGLPTTPTRIRRELAEPGEVSVVSVLENGATAVGITATLSVHAGSVRLTLSGDPGAGRDLSVRLALDGDGAGRVEFNVPLRYEATPACPVSMVDADGNEYPVVQIGAYCWQAENMRSSTAGNGAGIPAVTNTEQFMQWIAPDVRGLASRTTPAYTWYNHNPSYDAIYGKMYNHFAAVQVCPVGWRLANGLEFYNASVAAVGANNPGLRMAGALKSAGTEFWASPNVATNSTGFSALPGGMLLTGQSDFAYIGEGTTYWLADLIQGEPQQVVTPDGLVPYREERGEFFSLFHGEEGIVVFGPEFAQGGAYVRCITDINQ